MKQIRVQQLVWGTENRKFAVWLSFGPWNQTVSLWWSFFSMWCHIEKKLQQGSPSDENQEWRQRTVWLRVVPCLNLIWTVFFYVTDICLFTLGWLRYRYREVKARRRWVLGELCDWGSFPGMELSPSDGEAFTILDPALLSFNSSPTRYIYLLHLGKRTSWLANLFQSLTKLIIIYHSFHLCRLSLWLIKMGWFYVLVPVPIDVIHYYLPFPGVFLGLNIYAIVS